MRQEEKELVLKDLCARLLHGVKFACSKNVYTAKGIDLIVTDEGNWEYAVTSKGIAPVEIDFIKHYLRPMSSMTEDEREEWENTFDSVYDYVPEANEYDDSWHDEPGVESYDWLNANHFDYRGLIEKGLALEAPEDMYKPISK